MDNGRRLGWIAIAIGVVALVVALAGRGHEARFGGWGQPGFGNSGYGRSWEGPRGGFAPNDSQAVPGPNDNVGPRGGFGPHDGFGTPDGFGPRGGFGPRHGHFPFFLAPLFFLGGLLKFAGVIALVVIGLRWLRRRRNGGTGGGTPQTTQGPVSQTNPRPGPEGYTGETTNL